MPQAANQNSVEQIKAEVSQAMAAYHQSLGKCPPEESARLESILLEKIAVLSAYAELVSGTAGTVQ